MTSLRWQVTLRLIVEQSVSQKIHDDHIETPEKDRCLQIAECRPRASAMAPKHRCESLIVMM
ncbi:MAG: hypothetical protein CBC19_10105 [Oceanospirillales bacterium TMED59]|nr:MAG: hypothetical protein CBC19_10105 [Oceanospirillales bacterium TMED59]